MQLVILAAGMSIRLQPLTNDIPKCLLKIGEKTILQGIIENFLFYNIFEIIIVTGFMEKKIKDYINNSFPGLKITFISNDVYDLTNNCYSLWLSKNFINQDFFLIDSDILFDKRIIDKLLKSGYENCLAVEKNDNLGKEEIKVKIDDNFLIKNISKVVEPSESYGESIGIEKFSINFAKKLFERLEFNILKHDEKNLFYEKTFEDLINEGENIHCVDISEYKCIEIDFKEDLDRAEKEILPFIS